MRPGLRVVTVSVHKDYADYMEFVRSLGQHSESFLISIEADKTVKQLSLSSII